MTEASLTFPAELSSVGKSRAFLRAALGDWGVDDYDFGAAQVLTELAANAALHARTAFTVHLVLEPAALLVEVTDSSPVPPQRRRYGTEATTGRGIALVESLSEAWGVESSPTGKTVWCRVTADDMSPVALTWSSEPSGGTGTGRTSAPPGPGGHRGVSAWMRWAA